MKRLQRNHVFLIENVDVESAVHALYENVKISDTERERINCMESNDSKVEEILHLVKRRKKMYDIFMNSQSDKVKEQLETSDLECKNTVTMINMIQSLYR